MKKVAAETYRDIDFTRARRGAVAKAEPGKTKISIRLDNRVLAYFRSVVEDAGEGQLPDLDQRCAGRLHPAEVDARSGAAGRAGGSRRIQGCAPRCPQAAAGPYA